MPDPLKSRLERRILKFWGDFSISGRDEKTRKLYLQLDQEKFERFLYTTFLEFGKDFSIQRLLVKAREIFSAPATSQVGRKMHIFNCEHAIDILEKIDFALFPHLNAQNTYITPAGKTRPLIKPSRKWCSKCNKILPTDQFSFSFQSADGFKRNCNACYYLDPPSLAGKKKGRLSKTPIDDVIFNDGETYSIAPPPASLEHIDYLDNMLADIDQEPKLP